MEKWNGIIVSFAKMTYILSSQDFTPLEKNSKKFNNEEDLTAALSLLGFGSWSTMVHGK